MTFNVLYRLGLIELSDSQVRRIEKLNPTQREALDRALAKPLCALVAWFVVVAVFGSVVLTDWVSLKSSQSVSSDETPDPAQAWERRLEESAPVVLGERIPESSWSGMAEGVTRTVSGGNRRMLAAAPATPRTPSFVNDEPLAASLRYEVQSGDNMWSIVRKTLGLRENTEIHDYIECVRRVNPDKNLDNLAVGQVIDFPDLD